MNDFKPKKGNPCVLYDRLCTECGECMMCDLDPNKVCDNCGKCLEQMMPETNKKGFVEIPVEFEQDPDNVEEDDGLPDELKKLFAAYGLPVSAPKGKHYHVHDHDCDCEDCHDDHEHNCDDPNCHCHHHDHKH